QPAELPADLGQRALYRALDHGPDHGWRQFRGDHGRLRRGAERDLGHDEKLVWPWTIEAGWAAGVPERDLPALSDRGHHPRPDRRGDLLLDGRPDRRRLSGTAAQAAARGPGAAAGGAGRGARRI